MSVFEAIVVDTVFKELSCTDCASSPLFGVSNANLVRFLGANVGVPGEAAAAAKSGKLVLGSGENGRLKSWEDFVDSDIVTHTHTHTQQYYNEVISLKASSHSISVWTGLDSGVQTLDAEFSVRATRTDASCTEY